jgi:hypothetical protein
MPHGGGFLGGSQRVGTDEPGTSLREREREREREKTRLETRWKGLSGPNDGDRGGEEEEKKKKKKKRERERGRETDGLLRHVDDALFVCWLSHWWNPNMVPALTFRDLGRISSFTQCAHIFHVDRFWRRRRGARHSRSHTHTPQASMHMHMHTTDGVLINMQNGMIVRGVETNARVGRFMKRGGAGSRQYYLLSY